MATTTSTHAPAAPSGTISLFTALSSVQYAQRLAQHHINVLKDLSIEAPYDAFHLERLQQLEHWIVQQIDAASSAVFEGVGK
jgi:hypothetical protein